ncbi:PAS domain-containing protein [Pseudoxanthomonas sp. UTMC 1351]|uniref:PAS domain-containing protein n=1 Tax=Pseudoxanthomonas sp. UTMC 1351 TaxID=2695853 RepID=UPI0034CF11E1
MRAAQMGTWAWDARSDELDLDTFERQLFGLGEGPYKAAELAVHIHPEDIGPFRDAVRRALKEGVAVDYDFRVPTKEGGWSWVEGSAIRHSMPGKPTYLIGVNRDITQRKREALELSQAKHESERALAALVQSRADLELALRSGRLGVWHSEVRGADTADRDSPGQLGLEQPVDWDVNTRRIFGRGPDEPVTRRHYFEALHPEDRERVLAGLAHSGGGEYADQYRIILPDGQVRVIAVYAAAPTMRVDPDTAEDVYSMTGIVHDVTDEETLKANLRHKVREAQQATSDLEQARAALELALRSGRLGVWGSEYRDVSEADSTDDPGLEDPVDWDVNVRRIFGRSADEPVTRRDFFEALHPDDRGRVLDQVRDAAERGGYYTDKYRIRLPDGRMRWVEIHATIEPRDASDANANRRITGIARDITDEENLKADLRKTALEAQLAMEAKARFLAMMSHEIRTPMNGVVGMIELLLETSLSAEQHQMLRTCKDSAFALLTVINDILDFSKIEAGKLELEHTQLSLRRLAESVGESLGTHATQRGIDLDIDISPEVPRRVIGDRVRLRQILTNLIGNAIKFTDRGGVVVTVSMERGGANAEHGAPIHVRFEIADSGIGMDEDTLKNLFQPFQQADAATTRRFGGTGLGLSIVKHLAELMGGWVECESQLLHGSRFSVVIPFKTVAASEYDWGYSITGVRVLALVARKLRQRILTDLLRQFGVNVEFFDSAEKLLMRAQAGTSERSFDLVLLDRDWTISECAGLRRCFDEIRALCDVPFVVVRSSESLHAQLISNATLVNGNPLTRANLIPAIAVALGRISAPVPAIAADEMNGLAAVLSREQEEAAGRLILLAEDNATNRDVICRQLARLGYACDVAEDGARAWTMLHQSQSRYGLLLTDCHMPRLDGYELTRRIRAHEQSSGAPSLPIIAITANALQGEGERCFALGMDGYLAKPLQIRDLKRIMDEFLPSPAVSDLIVTEHAAEGTMVRFRELADILGNNEQKLRHVLGVFERSTRADCELLDAAYAAGDWRRVRDLAHKLKSGCRQLGEESAAIALDNLEAKAKSDAEFDGEFAAARPELQQVLVHVRARLEAEPSFDGVL